jgi:hypothetical protein
MRGTVWQRLGEDDMRHVGSIVLSLVLIALVLSGTAYGVTQWLDGTNPEGTRDSVKLAIGAAALVVAGLLYAVLVLSRLSPLGPVLAGLALLGVALWTTLALDSFDHVVPASFAKITEWPLGPVGVLLAVPLLATIVSPRRWRRWANPSAAVAPAHTPGPSAGAAFGPPTPYQRPSYLQQPRSAPPYPPLPGSVDPTAAAWPAPATADELTDPDATQRL